MVDNDWQWLKWSIMVDNGKWLVQFPNANNEQQLVTTSNKSAVVLLHFSMVEGTHSVLACQRESRWSRCDVDIWGALMFDLWFLFDSCVCVCVLCLNYLSSKDLQLPSWSHWLQLCGLPLYIGLKPWLITQPFCAAQVPCVKRPCL